MDEQLFFFGVKREWIVRTQDPFQPGIDDE